MATYEAQVNKLIGEDHPDIQLLQSQVTSIYNQMSQFEKKSSQKFLSD